MSAEDGKEIKPTARRDHLINIEKEVRQQWSDAKLYQHDAPTDPQQLKEKKKFMVTFPYPYMNGALHLGHAFSVVKAEFAVRFQRLLGKHTLFPFGFHCTGMPILACAQKLQNEVKRYGNPPQFPVAVEEAPEEEEAADDAVEAAPEAVEAVKEGEAPKEKKRKKKGKLAGKASKEIYQWNIMKEMGVPESEISAFQDPKHWLSYFPPIAQRDLNNLGLAVDWRRSFITTDVNPYYDAFIKWQFTQLRAKNKVSYGKLMCIVTPSNMQVCADHDRRDGEGVTAQAYTLIKLRLLAPFPPTLVEMLGKAGLTIKTDENTGKDAVDVILPAATLRPETMYGQTNAFVLPTGEYNVYRISENEVYICTDRSALNMAHQDIFQSYPGSDFVNGQCASRKLGNIMGNELLGCAIKAPLAQYDHVHILPLLSILMDKGTGVVTSVPSDAPADYAALTDMKNKKEFRAKYGITDEMVLPYEVVPIIRIDELDTDQAAVMLCKKHNVKSQNDTAILNQLKDECYKYGFDKGVMIVGDHAGKPVKEVKDTIKAWMISEGMAQAYSEPESRVVSRTDEDCVAALVDQWFLTYGEESWQKAIRDHVTSENFNSNNKSIHHKVLFTISWLKQWGCSRAFGLGTRLPFDDKFLVESLSDSTIYMAYYTIANFLQGGVLDGSQVGEAAIKPEQLTNELFDYVFLEAPYKASIGVAEDVLIKMRREFEFWYPMDLRVSGKDLLNNHLIMALYNHSAIWDNRVDRMPKSFYANGLLMIDSKKMSKSTGNFLTLAQALNLYGADATRFGLASSGDSLDDANFSSSIADAAILRLTREETFIEETIADAGSFRTGELLFWDQVMLNKLALNVQQTKTAYEGMLMMDVIKYGFHEMVALRDEYRVVSDTTPLHKDVLLKWIETIVTIMSPITPYWSQAMYAKLQAAGIVTSTEKFVYNAAWPVCPEVNSTLLKQANYITTLASLLRGTHAKTGSLLTKKNKGVKVVLNKLVLKIAAGYPAWQTQIIQKLQEIVANYVPEEDAAEGTNALSSPLVVSAIKDMFVSHPNKKILTNAMSFTASIKAEYALIGNDALQLTMPFDELAVVKEHISFILRTLEPITADNAIIESFVPPEEIPANGAAGPTPGKPQMTFSVE